MAGADVSAFCQGSLCGTLGRGPQNFETKGNQRNLSEPYRSLRSVPLIWGPVMYRPYRSYIEASA